MNHVSNAKSVPDSSTLVTPVKRLHYPNIFWIAFAHLMVIAAIPFFTWKAFGVCLFGIFVLAPLGVNLGFHRLLTHRSLKVPKWMEYTFATFGAMIGGGPPLHWVAEHRLHHRYSDLPDDPHNSRQGFWHAHITHLFYHKDFEDIEEQWMKYVPEMRNDKYFLFLNKYWIFLSVLTLVGLYFWGGIPFVMWGGFVRVVIMLHITWFVNSASHMWGYRRYKTRDNSVNNWWVGILAAGEGWHNNHHAYPNSAAHGHKWYEFDVTYLWISLFEKLGLATDVKRPAHFSKAKATPSPTKLIAEADLSPDAVLSAY